MSDVGAGDVMREGEMAGVAFSVSGGGIVQLRFREPGHGQDSSIYLLLEAPEADIRIDGDHVVQPHGYVQERAAVLYYLLTHHCTARLWAEKMRYGAAVRAEFTTIAEGA